jgi:hypothetical protein
MTSPERTPKKALTVALVAVACLCTAIATVVNTCYIAYSMHVTLYSWLENIKGRNQFGILSRDVRIILEWIHIHSLCSGDGRWIEETLDGGTLLWTYWSSGSATEFLQLSTIKCPAKTPQHWFNVLHITFVFFYEMFRHSKSEPLCN